MAGPTRIRFIYARESFDILRVIVPEVDDDELDFHEPAPGEGKVDAARGDREYSIRNFPTPDELRQMFLCSLAEAL